MDKSFVMCLTTSFLGILQSKCKTHRVITVNDRNAKKIKILSLSSEPPPVNKINLYFVIIMVQY